MNGITLASVPAARPKVFRPPTALVPEPEDTASLSHLLLNPPLLIGIALVAVLVIMNIHNASPNVSENAAPLIVQKPLETPLTKEAMAAVLPEAQDKTIVLHGPSGGSIVGQMARIPAESEQITEIRPISEVDKTAGRELLSIVGKY